MPETPPNIVVMAKPPVPGRVKTRLLSRYTPHQAALLHGAMLECILERVETHVPGTKTVNLILASDQSLTPDRPDPQSIEINKGPHWQLIDQGTGDLGQRLTHVWQSVGNGPVVFLGADTPDVPAGMLGSILLAIESAHVAVGPVKDGGYWTLSAQAPQLSLVRGIDWGSSTVYHQTLVIAEGLGLNTVSLDQWHDIDRPADLDALRQRINVTQEPALVRLRMTIDRVLQDMN